MVVVVIFIFVIIQFCVLVEQEIKLFEVQFIEVKKVELKNYFFIVWMVFGNIYGFVLFDNEVVMFEVIQVFLVMIYGQDGYFFVFDYDGNNFVSLC